MDRWEEFNYIIDNVDLDLKEKGLLLIIFRFYNDKKGYSYPSIKQLKELSKITDDRTLYNILNSLIDKNVLVKETVKGIGCKYFIPTVKNVPTVKITDTVENTDTPTVKITDTPTVKITEQKEKKKKNKRKVIYKDFDNIEKVKITQEQYDKLVNEFGKDLVDRKIYDMENFVVQKNKPYKDYNMALITWLKKEKLNKQQHQERNYDNIKYGWGNSAAYKPFEFDDDIEKLYEY